MKKKVTRKYFSKKKNAWVTKEYEYEKNYYKYRGKNVNIVYESGRVNKKKLNELLSKTSDPGAKANINAIVKSFKNRKEALTFRGLASRLEEDKKNKFLINTGYTEKEFNREYSGYGITIDDLFDPNKTTFKNNVFTLQNGRKFQLVWGYDESIFKEIV